MKVSNPLVRKACPYRPIARAVEHEPSRRPRRSMDWRNTKLASSRQCDRDNEPHELVARENEFIKV